MKTSILSIDLKSLLNPFMSENALSGVPTKNPVTHTGRFYKFFQIFADALSASELSHLIPQNLPSITLCSLQQITDQTGMRAHTHRHTHTLCPVPHNPGITTTRIS